MQNKQAWKYSFQYVTPRWNTLSHEIRGRAEAVLFRGLTEIRDWWPLSSLSLKRQSLFWTNPLHLKGSDIKSLALSPTPSYTK